MGEDKPLKQSVAYSELANDETVFRSLTDAFRKQLTSPLPAGLYPVSTPIGNLGDISLRALSVLFRADRIYCEDKRHSVRLLNHFGIRSELRTYHEHNADKEREPLLQMVAEGKVVALISDAGTPLVSDPGYKLVREARARDLLVVGIPGASAPLTALVAGGLPTDSFHFAGFLPPKKQARRNRAAELAGIEGTLILFESPKRVAACLSDLAEVLGARQAAVARELTKLHEEVDTGTLTELAERYAAADSVKGEIVLLIGASEEGAGEPSEEQLTEAIRAELEKSSVRDAVKAICARYDLPRSKVYDLALEIKNGTTS